jgi:pilus assembly protein Flp/PilA
MLLKLYTMGQIRFNELQERAREEKGAAAVEYGLLVALIAAVIVLVVKELGSKVSNAFSSVDANLP